jgi:hypothetical protein
MRLRSLRGSQRIVTILDFVGGLSSCHGSVHGMGILKRFLGNAPSHSFARDFLWLTVRTAQRLIWILKKRMTLGEMKNLVKAVRQVVQS